MKPKRVCKDKPKPRIVIATNQSAKSLWIDENHEEHGKDSEESPENRSSQLNAIYSTRKTSYFQQHVTMVTSSNKSGMRTSSGFWRWQNTWPKRLNVGHFRPLLGVRLLSFLSFVAIVAIIDVGKVFRDTTWFSLLFFMGLIKNV